MSKDNITQQTTFWTFLKSQKIEIPIIQRDYAQGRSGNEKLREKFLKDLKESLDKNTVLKLDFVYGSLENGSLNPLDGQQRLTTLWLLHWYIAFRAGELSKNKHVFERFSYETRVSSREFCKQLSSLEITAENGILQLIQNQTWFQSLWKQDPTVSAMLNMLGGTSEKDEKGEEIFDGIEEVFFDKTKFEEYWIKLTSENCPIKFYYLPLAELSLSDDLYIKMNARGKALTSFENFKADLVGYIDKKEWDKDKTEANKISHKLDTSWTDIFWKNKSEEHKIDNIYFSFINSYFLNSLITAKNDKEIDLYTQEAILNNKLYKYLSDNSSLKYNGFEIYKSEENVFDKLCFERLTMILDKFHLTFKSFTKEDIDKLFFPSWDDHSDFRFIPVYKTEGEEYITSTPTDRQRVVFYAICCYFENNEYEEKALKDWMRFVWNIVIDPNLAMIGAMRFIKEIAKHSGDIITFLCDNNEEVKISKTQFEEESIKAKLIKSVKDDSYEKAIIKAESHKLFKGNIQFLLSKGINTTIEDFNTERDIAFLITQNTGDYLWIRSILANAGRLPTTITLSNINDNWRYLINSSLMEAFRNLISNFKNIDYQAQSAQTIMKNICANYKRKEELLWVYPLVHWVGEKGETLLDNYSDTKRIVNYYNQGSIYLYNKTNWTEGNILLSNYRNEIIQELLKDKEMIYNSPDWSNIDNKYFRGWNIKLIRKTRLQNQDVEIEYLFDRQYLSIGIKETTELQLSFSLHQFSEPAKFGFDENEEGWLCQKKYDYLKIVKNEYDINSFLKEVEEGFQFLISKLNQEIE
ncbi:DUF262 domain-containing protein [Flavobacterium sp. WC2416]|uniref:DUF262 domain-containing protein n=1 Tax=Flavobacterium sp. WC2416 TaxID=3234141 RepID=A0AB39WBD0_9FLAO